MKRQIGQKFRRVPVDYKLSNCKPSVVLKMLIVYLMMILVSL